MRQSRKTALAILLLAFNGTLAAQPVTAEQVMERYRQTVPTIDALDCPPAKGDEVVVCGRRGEDQRHRLPLPLEEDPGRIVPGERFSKNDLMTLDDKQACVSHRGCAKAAIPLIPIAVFIVNTIVKAAKAE